MFVERNIEFIRLLLSYVTEYARSGDAYIAYQVRGEGDVDVLMRSYGMISIDAFDREPHVADFLQRLGRFARVILYDTRGVGLSDPISLDAPPTLEQEVADGLAVLDATGSEQAVILGVVWGGPMAILFAATHPARTRALVLCNTFARIRQGTDYPFGPKEEDLVARIRQITDPGSDLDASVVHAPSLAGNGEFRRWWTEEGRRGASPRTAQALMTVSFLADVRDVLASVRVPTLVIGRTGSGSITDRAEIGRWLGDHAPGGRYVELPGDDAFPFSEGVDQLLGELEEFVTGERREVDPCRVLATVVFTDMVSSTDHAASLGDREWRALLDRHDAMVRRQIERFGGREVKTTGDGFLMTFDGPARAVRSAIAIREGAAQLGIAVRAGVHTGEVELRGEDVSGIAVHLAQRVSACAGASQVFTSTTVKDLVFGSGLEFEAMGTRELKGIPGSWQLFEAKG